MGITTRQFKALQERVSPQAGQRRTAAPVLEASPTAVRKAFSVILGLDPSLRGTGYGLLQVNKSELTAITFGTGRCPATWGRSLCLAKIAGSLREVVHQYKPEVCAVEGLFFAHNLQTALMMGEARGAALATIAEAGLPIFEVAPRKVKQAIVGYGAAEKLAVAKMVQRMLRLGEPPEPDAADALALALAYAQGQGRYALNQPRRI